MPGGAAGGQPGPGMPGFDNEAYMKAMGGVLQNPQFMEMAEKLGQQIMSVRCLSMLGHLLEVIHNFDIGAQSVRYMRMHSLQLTALPDPRAPTRLARSPCQPSD